MRHCFGQARGSAAHASKWSEWEEGVSGGGHDCQPATTCRTDPEVARQHMNPCSTPSTLEDCLAILAHIRLPTD